MIPLRLVLPHCVFWSHWENRIVETVFPDGKACAGTREESQTNLDEARDQGYTGPDAVWRSLVEHELGHSLVSLWMWDSPSPTLRHEAGGERCDYGTRLFEESLVIGFQTWQNTGQIPRALEHLAERLPRWRVRFSRAVSRLEEAA